MSAAFVPGTFTPVVATYASGDIGPVPYLGAIFGLMRLDTDPVGVCQRTFDGVNAGSEIRVFSPAGTELAGIESCASNQVLTWDVFSSNNTVRIVIVNELYGIKEFNYLSSVGVASIPIQQEIDKWYKNPA